jgi:hypothetical protein
VLTAPKHPYTQALIAARSIGGHGVDQGLGVRVLRGREHLSGRTLLDDGAAAHHDDVVRDRRHDGQVVADEEEPSAALLDAVEESDDPRLDGDVERGGRFVCDEEVGVQGDRRSDEGALPEPARQLTGTLTDAGGRLGHADGLQHLEDSLGALPPGEPGPEPEGVVDLPADRTERVE